MAEAPPFGRVGLSGKRPDTTGVVDNFMPTRTHLPDTVMLPQLFRQQGWRSEKVGKLYHTGDAFEDPPSRSQTAARRAVTRSVVGRMAELQSRRDAEPRISAIPLSTHRYRVSSRARAVAVSA